MKNHLKKLMAVSALCCATLTGSGSAEAAVGIVSLLGGPHGIILIKIGGAMAVGGTLGTMGVCYIGEKTAHWDKEDCGMLPMFLVVLPGLVLLDADGSKASSQIAAQLGTQYHADAESANRIADRIYNKAMAASKAQAQSQEAQAAQADLSSDERLVINAKVSLTAQEIAELSEPEFLGSAGYNQLVQDYR